MARQRIPGLSIGILRGDSVVLARGYGYANLELHVPASDSSIYQSGSLGKQFTAAAVAMLSQQGRLSLDAVITRWLPEGRGVWDSVTVRHLLTHTGGVPEYTDSTFDYRKDYTEAELVRFAAARPLDFSPGTRWSYSNTGYLLLGVLVHRLTGKFYGDVLRDLLFGPLGMRSTRIISEADIVPNRADGYRRVGGQVKNQEWVAPSLNTTADGSLYFSIRDLVRWAGGLDHGPTPGASVLKQAWSPVRLRDGGRYPYGFGWDLSGQRDHQRIGHTGSWQGFKTALYRYPEFDLTVIVLANLAEAEAGALAQGVAGIVQPALQPAQLLSDALSGPRPPRPNLEVLRQIATDTAAGFTPGLRRFLSDEDRKELGESMDSVRTWTELGCEGVGSQIPSWLGARLTRICYTRGVGGNSRALYSVLYTDEWRPGFFETQTY